MDTINRNSKVQTGTKTQSIPFKLNIGIQFKWGEK